MAEGIAEVLKSHQLANYSRERYCLCGTFLGDWADEATTAAHQAGVLAANGYGKLEDVWDEGFEAGQASMWGDGYRRPNPINPYRRPE